MSDTMGERLARLEERVEELERVTDHHSKITLDYQLWKRWLIGVFVAIAALFTFFSDQIKHLLGMK